MGCGKPRGLDFKLLVLTHSRIANAGQPHGLLATIDKSNCERSTVLCSTQDFRVLLDQFSSLALREPLWFFANRNHSFTDLSIKLLNLLEKER
jgi:hypothetical protein